MLYAGGCLPACAETVGRVPSLRLATRKCYDLLVKAPSAPRSLRDGAAPPPRRDRRRTRRTCGQRTGQCEFAVGQVDRCVSVCVRHLDGRAPKTPMFPRGYNLATRWRRAAGPRARTRAAAQQRVGCSPCPNSHRRQPCGMYNFAHAWSDRSSNDAIRAYLCLDEEQRGGRSSENEQRATPNEIRPNGSETPVQPLA